jgi:hypothetical protein
MYHGGLLGVEVLVICLKKCDIMPKIQNSVVMSVASISCLA